MGERFPIGDAPMDGTRVRLFHEEETTSSELCPTYGHFDSQRWIMNQLFVFERDGRAMLSRVPTHWAPLTPTSHQPSEASR